LEDYGGQTPQRAIVVIGDSAVGAFKAGETVTDNQGGMLYFLRRGDDALSYETRLRDDGPGYELVISRNGETHAEQFESLSQLLTREHELLQAWRAQGWRDVQRGATGRP